MESLLLCEGYHDRGFLAGWLQALGCQESRRDPDGKPVGSGHFGFTSPQGGFLRITPCHGQNPLGEALRTAVKHSPRRVVIFRDLDGSSGERFEHLPAMTKEQDLWTKDGEDWYRKGDCWISLVEWGGDLRDAVGVPAQSNLERLLCNALVQGSPECGERVETWLEGLPACGGKPSVVNGKSYFLSYVAGWFPDQQNQIHQHLWKVELFRERLLASLAGRPARVMGTLLSQR